MRIIDGHELDPAFHQVGDEVHIAGKAIEFRDNQRRLVALASGEGSLQLGTVRPFSALDLSIFGRELIFGVPSNTPAPLAVVRRDQTRYGLAGRC
jgi:hypothetical protein